jgi:Ca2+-binding EF-hand superfamily protein
MQKRQLIATLTALLSLPLVSFGAEEKKKGGGFASADADKSGSISLTEYQAAMKGRLDSAAAAKRFAELDKDKNGSLSQQEFNAGIGGDKKGEGDKKGGDKKGGGKSKG